MTLWGVVVLLLLGLLPVRSASAQREVARFALVIGNNVPESADTPTLRYADDDAVATHQLLTEAGIESVLLARLDRDSQKLHPQLAPPAPRWSDFERVSGILFERMRKAASAGARTELLIFYSGHGDVEGGEGYLVLEDRHLTRTMLYTLLSRSPAARNHVFIDACKSYFLAFEKGPGGQRAEYGKSFVSAQIPAQLANTGFVLSTSSDRDSHEWERYQAGILTHELRSALRGAADVDGDGRVTYAEIGGFLAVANQNIVNPKFRPDFMVRPPGADLSQEVLEWRGRASAVRLDGRALGHLYLETARGERVLDVHPAADTSLTLYVPEERPLFLRRNDETTEDVIATRAKVVISSLAVSSPEIARRGALHLAFQELFAAPFGPGDVSEFERAHVAQAASSDTSPKAAPETRKIARMTTGVIAIAAVASGLSLSFAAWRKYESGAGASQVRTAELNETVHRINIASIACYALASAAGATWAWLRWGPRPNLAIEPAAAKGGRRDMTIGLSAAF